MGTVLVIIFRLIMGTVLVIIFRTKHLALSE